MSAGGLVGSGDAHRSANAQLVVKVREEERRGKVYDVNNVPEPVDLVKREPELVRSCWRVEERRAAETICTIRR